MSQRNRKKQTYRYREQTSVCQKGERGTKQVKGIQVQTPVVKLMSQDV